MSRHAKTLSVFSLSAKYPTEASAVHFFERRRWGKKPVCPHCGGTNTSPRRARHGHRCKPCRKDFSVRVGTVFECSRLPLRKWLFAMYFIQTARKGVSALQLSKELDVGYRAAWFMGHRIRTACGPEDDLLKGEVEVDETYFGGAQKNRHESKREAIGGGTRGKAAVLGMRERGGRVRAFPIADAKAKSIIPVMQGNIAAGSVVYTDEWVGYNQAAVHFAEHKRVHHTVSEYVNQQAHTNGIESVWAVLKRGYKGTFHHMSPKHLHRYVDEFSFRLNEGNVRVDTIDRLAAIVDGATGKRLTYRALTGGADRRKPGKRCTPLNPRRRA